MAVLLSTIVFGSSAYTTIPNTIDPIHQERSIKIQVAPCPLAQDSLQLVPHQQKDRFTQWNDSEHQDTHSSIQKIAHIWNGQGIQDYLVFGKVTDSKPFNWEVVPYEKAGWRFWKQFKVLWKITFGASCISSQAQQQVANRYPDTLFAENIARKTAEVARGNDAFCTPDVINRQRVLEGKHVNILYNYAPIGLGKDQLHFLIVPKEHRPTFSDVTKEEYTEAATLAQKLIDHFQEKQIKTAYLFHKTGAEAGQTVPHWHLHVILTASKIEELWGKLTVLKNMTWGSSPLPPQELQKRVTKYKEELSD